MNKTSAHKLYHLGTKIVFQSISKRIAEKLVEFAATHKVGEIIKINGVEYKLDHVSLNGRYACASVYYLSRNRLIRVSDHWSAIQRGFAPAKSEIQSLKGVGKIATSWWQLVGDDQSFVPTVEFKTQRYDIDWDCGTTTWSTINIKNHKFEGGFVPLRQIDLEDECAKRGRIRMHKRS